MLEKYQFLEAIPIFYAEKMTARENQEPPRVGRQAQVENDEAIRLIFRGARVSDAAASAGFSSQGHLTRHLRRLIGVTPGALVPNRRRRG